MGWQDLVINHGLSHCRSSCVDLTQTSGLGRVGAVQSPYVEELAQSWPPSQAGQRVEPLTRVQVTPGYGGATSNMAADTRVAQGCRCSRHVTDLMPRSTGVRRWQHARPPQSGAAERLCHSEALRRVLRASVGAPHSATLHSRRADAVWLGPVARGVDRCSLYSGVFEPAPLAAVLSPTCLHLAIRPSGHHPLHGGRRAYSRPARQGRQRTHYACADDGSVARGAARGQHHVRVGATALQAVP